MSQKQSQLLLRGSVLLILLGGLLCWTLTQTKLDSDLTLFLPSGVNPQQALMVDQLRAGSGARFLLIALENAPPETLARLSKQLSKALHAATAIQFVNNGAARWSKQDQAWLFQQRYLLSQRIQPQYFSTQHLAQALQARLQELASPLGALSKRYLPQDPTGEYQHIVQHWLPAGGPTLHLGVWFSADHQQALLIAQTRAPGFDLDGQARALAALEQAFASLADRQETRLLRSGSGVFSTTAREAIRKDIQRLSLGATLWVGLLLLWAYRSFPLLLLCALPLALGILAAIIVVGGVFGALHGITLAFGITLIGVAVDYPIHFYGHWPLARSSWENARAIGPTIALGALTTAMGYAAMLFSGFPGLMQLSLFAIVGLVTAAASTRYLLPWLLADRPTPKPHHQTNIAPKHPGSHYRGLPFLPVAGLLLAVSLLATTKAPLWQNDLAALSPLPPTVKALDQRLRSQLQAPELRWLITLWGEHAEQVLQTAEKLIPPLQQLQKKGALAGFEVAARYLPSQQSQRIRQAALPTTESLQTALQTAVANTPFRPGVFAPFIEAVQRSKTQTPLTLADVGEGIIQTRLTTQLFSWQKQWVGLVQLSGVADPQALRHALNSLHDPNIQLVDLRAASNAMIKQYRNAALQLLTWGILAILAMLSWRLASLAMALRILLPLLAALSLTVAFLVWLGEALSLFHLFSLLLVFGLGLDYGLFLNRSAASRQQWQQTAHAVVICGLSTISVFGLLAQSNAPVLQAIGITVCLGTSIALVLAWTNARPTIG